MLGTVMTVGDQEQNPCLLSPLSMTLRGPQKAMFKLSLLSSVHVTLHGDTIAVDVIS